MDKRHFLLALAASLTLPALAAPFEPAPRDFPVSAKRGRMTPGYAPDLLIDGKPRQMSPACRIYNQDNLFVVPAALRERDMVVNYTEDRDGNIDRVWILTAEEARQPAPATR